MTCSLQVAWKVLSRKLEDGEELLLKNVSTWICTLKELHHGTLSIWKSWTLSVSCISVICCHSVACLHKVVFLYNDCFGDQLLSAGGA